MQGTKLFVGNLSYAADRDKVKELFEEFGKVESVTVLEGKGFGFVEMASSDEAEKAREGLNGKQFMGRTLNVDEARPRDKGKPRSGGGGGGGGGGFGGRGRY